MVKVKGNGTLNLRCPRSGTHNLRQREYMVTRVYILLTAPFIIYTEILEFDAAEEPPSVLDVEVFDFEGPFDQAASLGHAEINFLKHTSTELADIWVLLEGKLAQSSQSKLHLRIFLDNNNGVETIKEYLTKMEKEVGKKVHMCLYMHL